MESQHQAGSIERVQLKSAHPPVAPKMSKLLWGWSTLPRELRDIVYEYALIHQEPIRICGYRHHRVGYRDPNVASLIQATRQIRDETLEMFYQSNEFSFEDISLQRNFSTARPVPGSHFGPTTFVLPVVQTFLRDIGPRNQLQLRRLNIKLTWYHFPNYPVPGLTATGAQQVRRQLLSLNRLLFPGQHREDPVDTTFERAGCTLKMIRWVGGKPGTLAVQLNLMHPKKSLRQWIARLYRWADTTQDYNKKESWTVTAWLLKQVEGGPDPTPVWIHNAANAPMWTQAGL